MKSLWQAILAASFVGLPLFETGLCTAGLAQEKTSEKQTPQYEPEKISLSLLERGGAQTQTHTVNGVKFDLSVVAREDKKGTVIDLHWKITNVKARSPLVIIKPTLDQPTGATALTLCAVPSGKDYALAKSFYRPVEYEPLGGDGITGVSKEITDRKWYECLALGKSANGTIPVSVGDVKEYFLKCSPGVFDNQKAPPLYVFVAFFPVDRGNSLGLDAWTGAFHLEPIRVLGIPKW